MATSITIIKRFTYRDTPEEWSNKYYLDGADPANATEWNTLFTALAGEEKKLYVLTCEIVRAYGYTSDSSTASSVWSKDLVTAGPVIPGTLTPTGAVTPGDIAANVWWKTARLSSTGKPIYLRKYFHAVRSDAGDPDQVASAHVTAYEAFATLLSSGAGVDSRHIRGPGQASDTIYDSGCNAYVTTRTLKRRGRRPTPAP